MRMLRDPRRYLPTDMVITEAMSVALEEMVQAILTPAPAHILLFDPGIKKYLKQQVLCAKFFSALTYVHDALADQDIRTVSKTSHS